MKPSKNKIVLFQMALLVFSLSARAAEKPCSKNSKVRFLKDNQYVYQSINYCFLNKSKISDSPFVLAKPCFFRKIQECYALKSFRTYRSSEYPRSFGTPTHHYCRAIGGIPLFWEFKQSKKWISKAICQFPDKSFVSLDYLVYRN